MNPARTPPQRAAAGRAAVGATDRRAGRKALEDAGVSPDRIGLLVNTSVSRDFLEPSTASIVSGNLGLGDEWMRKVLWHNGRALLERAGA